LGTTTGLGIVSGISSVRHALLRAEKLLSARGGGAGHKGGSLGAPPPGPPAQFAGGESTPDARIAHIAQQTSDRNLQSLPPNRFAKLAARPSIVSEMNSFASGTIVSAGTSSPLKPGTQPVSSNISLALSKRALSPLGNTLLMVGFLVLVQCDRFRGTGFTEYLAGNSAHSGLMLAARITLPHFSVSSAMSLPKSEGERQALSRPV
jgi:hypothetical protein